MMKISKKWRMILTLTLGMGALSTLTFNCAPRLFEPLHPRGSSSLSSYRSPCGLPDCFAKPESPYAMLTSFQAFSSMLNVTDQVGQVSASMLAEYDARKGALPDSDNMAAINAPMQMSGTSLAGEVCGALIAKETTAGAVRKFFTDVDFTRNIAGNPAAAYDKTIQTMARNFWGRSISSEEHSILSSYYADFAASYGAQGNAAEQVRATRKLYLSACAAMLSSFDAMIN
ncbi:MAG TPA: hypothetical protein PKC28_01630 [Bdellovibrionales bacterium]|nr:hypothetical protein [Bdellovibrionales bacterium]